MRTLVIGDIHSGLKALEQVLQRAQVTVNDKLVFLGDYVDGWSQAVETVNFLIDLEKTHNCYYLRGNHDELCSDWLVKGENNPMYGKYVLNTKKYVAHDEQNDCNEGDTVRIMETRPLSKSKRWRLVEILERAK